MIIETLALTPALSPKERENRSQSIRCLFVLGLLSARIALAQIPPPSQSVSSTTHSFTSYTLSYTNQVDWALQTNLEAIDARLRDQFGMTTNETCVGLLDLKNLRLAMLRPDHEEYGAAFRKSASCSPIFSFIPKPQRTLIHQFATTSA